MEVKGNIKVINDTQVISEQFSKREFVVTTNDTYPQDILIQLTQDKCSLLDMFKVGQDVEVSINLRGREWTSPKGEVKYFNTIEGWKISGGQTMQQEQHPQALAPDPMTKEEEDDLLLF